MTLRSSDPMLGSVPVKPRYVRCHGKVACRIVAEPVVQAPTVPLLRKPTRAPGVFVMVRECKLPESVTGHTALPPNESVNVMLVQVAVRKLLLAASLLADAVPTMRPMTAVALIAMISTFPNFSIRGSFHDEDTMARFDAPCVKPAAVPPLPWRQSGHAASSPWRRAGRARPARSEGGITLRTAATR